MGCNNKEWRSYSSNTGNLKKKKECPKHTETRSKPQSKAASCRASGVEVVARILSTEHTAASLEEEQAQVPEDPGLSN